MASEKHFKYVILGGGVAAVCALSLFSLAPPKFANHLPSVLLALPPWEGSRLREFTARSMWDSFAWILLFDLGLFRISSKVRFFLFLISL
jgi:hypothetical protein